ncbi:glycosyltransferase [Synechococcus sp. UW179B]|uniref:glycosyltransferase n=1 Tax=Synechococcus sp. UW179B TaxID=2575516 RepID=UPI000E0EF708|nr:glycosyltransferase [Synechococcus sp. UW179B]
MHSRLPALLMVPDLLPGGGPLNGRRWAGQQLLKLWLSLAAGQELPLLVADPVGLGNQIQALLQSWGAANAVSANDLFSTNKVERCGALMVPDPSIGIWSGWRDAFSTPASFSLIGQIHTLCTTGAMARIEELTAENILNWDALICSSNAGRAVVEAVLSQREQRNAARAGVAVSRFRQHRPQLPVIPLPMPVTEIQQKLPDRLRARQVLGLPAEADVVVWLGRITLYSKADPAPTYRMLERVAQQRDRPLVFVELGPDDGEGQVQAHQQRREECKHLRFLRIGGSEPVSEDQKLLALAAADLGVSLVDNVQETFGQSVVELLAAGLPVVASDWDGYRDLLVHGQHGWLIPSRWCAVAADASVPLGWQHRLGMQSYASVAGALAQLVQLDLAAAEAAVLTLLSQPKLRQAMGRQAAIWARNRFDLPVVAAHYSELFAELEQRRDLAPPEWRQRQPAALGLDPVACFAGFASESNASLELQANAALDPSPASLHVHREQLWSLLQACIPPAQHPALRQALEIKHGDRAFLR